MLKPAWVALHHAVHQLLDRGALLAQLRAGGGTGAAGCAVTCGAAAGRSFAAAAVPQRAHGPPRHPPLPAPAPPRGWDSTVSTCLSESKRGSAKRGSTRASISSYASQSTAARPLCDRRYCSRPDDDMAAAGRGAGRGAARVGGVGGRGGSGGERRRRWRRWSGSGRRLGRWWEMLEGWASPWAPCQRCRSGLCALLKRSQGCARCPHCWRAALIVD